MPEFRTLIVTTFVMTYAVAAAAASAISDAAFSLLNASARENRSSFYLYRDVDSGFNHGFLSGWFGLGAALYKIHLDAACVYDSGAVNGCGVSAAALDSTRGTVLRITFDPLSPGEYTGINIEEPENHGAGAAGAGYDLRGATQVCFDTLSPTPGLRVQFGVAQHMAAFFAPPSIWTTMCLNLAGLGISQAELAEVHFPFTIVTNDLNAPSGGTVLLDNIRFHPVPTAQQTALSLPLANRILGVAPVASPLPGRIPIPPDQVLANLTTIYESSLAVLALLARGTAEDLVSARIIADSFVYALSHDNQGAPIPIAPGGSRGLHNGMSSGDLPLHNNQAPGAGLAGQVRLAGFSVGSGFCGNSRFCLVLDGATGGNNAFVMLALIKAYEQFQDERYLSAAQEIGNWIHGNLLDTSGTGYGGYFLGYPDEGQAKVLVQGKSIENNADIYRAFMQLAETLRGAPREALEWRRRARIAGDFVMAMYDPVSGSFYAGTVPAGTPPSSGITPDGPARGNDIVNTYSYLDAQSFPLLAMANTLPYRFAIDWRRPVQWMLDHFSQTVTAASRQFRGFNLVAAPTAGPNGVAWEFTGQAVVAMRFVDELYRESRFESAAAQYMSEIAQAQTHAPFADGAGLVGSTMQGGDVLPPYEQCLSTPFQCIAERVGVAATAWAIFADMNANPFNLAGRR